jgi:hypothetical protein
MLEINIVEVKGNGLVTIDKWYYNKDFCTEFSTELKPWLKDNFIVTLF